MSHFMFREEFETPQGRRRAWRSLMWSDHGFLRKLYDNSHQISDEVWRTYQPSPLDIAHWADRGIKTIVNLRGTVEHHGGRQAGFYWLEEEAARKNGLTLINFRAFSREAPKPNFILEADKLFREMAYPAIFHCKSGADRAGITSTLYRFLREGVPLTEARGQLTYRYGHVKSGKTGVLDHFFDTYEAAATADGVIPNREHFLEWSQTAYDPAAVNKSFTPGKLGSLLTEVILRRE